MHLRNFFYVSIFGLLLAGCSSSPPKPSDNHISRNDAQAESTSEVPQVIRDSVILPPPRPAGKVATYSVVVTNVPVQEILFALARDAKINLDIQSGIQGAVTINAIDQTLPQILTRIAKQVDMRYQIENGILTVMPDTPYLKNYKIDYVNMSRDSESAISDTTQVGGSAIAGAGGASSAGNNSTLTIKDTSKNRFWDTLVQNIKDILHETDKILPAGSSITTVQQARSASSSGTGAQAAGGSKKSAPKDGIENSPNPINVEEGEQTITERSTYREAASVIANPENGIITVRATGKQHEKIQEFIDNVMANAQRQVLIEATVVEVHLSDQYQQGINWSRLSLGNKGFSLAQNGSAGLASSNTGSMFTLGYLNPTSKLGDFAASISLLESFGKVKVLSSPKLSVMNNQTAILRVVDNLVYFTVKADTTTNQTSTITTYTTTANTVPIGFTMSVTPQINDTDSVLLNMRPSISHLLGYVNDPNPALAIAGVVSRIPQTQTREMESVMKIDNNQIAVMGGLMQDSINNLSDEVPFVARIPLLGNLFKQRNDTTEKTELVIFLRPVIIKNASVNADFGEFRNSLPDENFFKDSSATK